MNTFFSIKWAVSDAEAPILLRDFLKQKQISKAALTDIKFHGGALFVNEEESTVRKMLQEGDVVHVCFPPEVLQLFYFIIKKMIFRLLFML
jgi:23S rRNA pseudouridine1911/1915/1917 synthase